MGSARLFIGELAEQVDLAPSALRYNEAAGLLEAEQRTESGYRVYDRRAADRLRFIQRAKSLGLKLSEIKCLVDSPRGTRDDERAFFNRFLASKIKETQSQIVNLRTTARHLRRIEATLTADPPPECCHLGDCTCWLPVSSVPSRGKPKIRRTVDPDEGRDEAKKGHDKRPPVQHLRVYVRVQRRPGAE